MNELINYATQWNVSAQYFYEKECYAWMADKLNGYGTVLEIGCGTGYSTLALAEKGHNIIAVDKNSDCINKAKSLFSKRGYNEEKVTFLEGDIADDIFRENLIQKYDFDVVICWNVGSYWNREMIEYYIPYMLEYGLNRQQIASNPESSYSELIIWDTCRLAKEKEVAAHIIDRGTELINEFTDQYYYALRDEFAFSNIGYDNKIADSISNGGRMLTTNGTVNVESKIDIIFISILLK